MRRDQILQMLEAVDDRFVTEAARFDSPNRQSPPERSASMKTKRILTFALAAALLLGLGVAAYAAGWIGPRAIVREELPEGGVVSLTQPQETPEDLDPAVEDKLETSRAAWSEWEAWLNTYQWCPDLPAVFDVPEGATGMEIGSDEDGWFITFLQYDRAIGTRRVSQEEMDALNAALDAAEGFESQYDFPYGCVSAESEAKLEEIAGAYGLRLRKNGEHLYSRETFETIDEWFNAQHGTSLHGDYSGPQYRSNEELATLVAEKCCHGDFFKETPLGFDKFYYFDEGSFAVSWYPVFTPERQVVCYVYNAAYGTLFSGNEVGGIAFDLDSFTERSHTCPDGTVFTVLESPDQAFFYAYLSNSYLCGSIGLGMTESEVDAVLDSVCWSNIGK